jgi:hypothetical protein
MNNGIIVELKIINKNLMVGTETFTDGTVHNVRYECIKPVSIISKIISKIKILKKKMAK